jgi:RNA polymerase sigma-70 factor, ECF subfamily
VWVVEDERDLVERSKRGDERAFAALVHAYQRVLFNLACRMVNDCEDARDLTQTVFLKAYAHLGGFDSRYRFFSWIYRIMMNESLNLLSRRRSQEELPRALAAEGGSAEELHERNRLRETIEESMKRLSPEHREVILLRHFLRLSHREMSDLLEIPEKTVKARLHSARRALQPILQRQGVPWT